MVLVAPSGSSQGICPSRLHRFRGLALHDKESTRRFGPGRLDQRRDPRPPQDDTQTYEKWRKMSLRVNIWLCNQVSQPILKLRPMRSTELRFADEHMAFFREWASNYKVSAVNRTWHAVMNMKRSQFDSLEKYVEEWRRSILKAEQQDLFLGAILELLRNVKDDIPDWADSITMRLCMDQPQGLSQEEFHRYCDKAIHAGQYSVRTTMPKKKSRGRNRRGKSTRSHVGQID